MNKTRFDKLPKKGQDQLLAAGLHYENESGRVIKDLIAIDNAKIMKLTAFRLGRSRRIRQGIHRNDPESQLGRCCEA